MKRIGITVGDPAGIGAEIILKSITELKKIKGFRFVILSPAGFLKEYSAKTKIKVSLPVTNNIEDTDEKIQVLESIEKISFRLGTPSDITGNAAYRIIGKGIRFALSGKIDALVTAPVSKFAINLTGKRFSGHTEMLKRMTGVKDVLMLFVSPQLKAGVVTTHIGFRNVSRNITEAKIISKLLLLTNGLKRFFSLRHPVIGVSALNPHAGEGGYIGNEEIKIIEPAIKKARGRGLKIDGPFPSDTILLKRDEFDALLFMYHDQAMIPLKLLSWGKNVNVTIGLPFVRTSPDHGTGFDIAGKGIASPDSFIEAVKLACRILGKARIKDKGLVPNKR
ncbi:MAG: 4-hydroxythreonine-4-phosphate dehydrogenase PdxA [Candidatus Cloacimonadota bacterium]|nr:MAG: 4-hydroxythreonine-4-phosphate dehydrogenase PdxA [Candidatus Cloacimonadota bacterium]